MYHVPDLVMIAYWHNVICQSARTSSFLPRRTPASQALCLTLAWARPSVASSTHTPQTRLGGQARLAWARLARAGFERQTRVDWRTAARWPSNSWLD